MLLYQRSFHLSFRKSVSLSVCQAVLFSFFLSLASFTHAESVPITIENLSDYEYYYVLVDTADNNTVYALVGTKSTFPCYTDSDGTRFCKRSLYLIEVSSKAIHRVYLADRYMNSGFDWKESMETEKWSGWPAALAKMDTTTIDPIITIFFNFKAKDNTDEMSNEIVTANPSANIAYGTANPLGKNGTWGWYPSIKRLPGKTETTIQHYSLALPSHPCFIMSSHCQTIGVTGRYLQYRGNIEVPAFTGPSGMPTGATVRAEYLNELSTNSQGIMPDVSSESIARKIFAKATGKQIGIKGISTRASVGKTAEKYMMAGVYVRGTVQKKALVRATGKGLIKQGVNTSLDAKLEVYELAKNEKIDWNDDWKQHLTNSAVQAAGGMPDTYDAALISGLNQGYYSMVVMPSGGSMSSGGGSSEGIGLVEIYDDDFGSASRLSGISTRSYVGASAADYMYAGLAIQGDIRVLIRGLGKGLVAQGVSGALDDAKIIVRKANGTVVDSNDNWQNHSSSSTLTQRGQAPKESSGAAMIINLSEGLYTIEVSSARGGSGVALVEVYEIVD